MNILPYLHFRIGSDLSLAAVVDLGSSLIEYLETLVAMDPGATPTLKSTGKVGQFQQFLLLWHP